MRLPIIPLPGSKFVVDTYLYADVEEFVIENQIVPPPTRIQVRGLNAIRTLVCQPWRADAALTTWRCRPLWEDGTPFVLYGHLVELDLPRDLQMHGQLWPDERFRDFRAAEKARAEAIAKRLNEAIAHAAEN